MKAQVLRRHMTSLVHSTLYSDNTYQNIIQYIHITLQDRRHNTSYGWAMGRLFSVFWRNLIITKCAMHIRSKGYNILVRSLYSIYFVTTRACDSQQDCNKPVLYYWNHQSKVNIFNWIMFMLLDYFSNNTPAPLPWAAKGNAQFKMLCGVEESLQLSLWCSVLRLTKQPIVLWHILE